MANEIDFSFLEPQDLMTKTTYDSNGNDVVEVAQDIDGFDTAADNTFYGKVGGVTGFFTVPSGAQAINDLTDVDTTGITIGQVLQYDGSGFVPLTITDQVGATILNELGDVDTTTTAPSNGDALVFDGTNFVPQAVSGGGASVISDLTDVDTTGVSLNNVLKYDGTNWVDGTIAYSEVTGTPTLATVATSGSYNDLSDQPTIPVNINDLGDVDTTGITSGQVLQYNGTNFIAATVSAGGASALDDLSDVDTTTTVPTNGDALIFDGTNFVPQAVSGGGASVISDLTDVDTTGVSLNNVLKYDGTNWVDGSVDYTEVSNTPTLATVATTGSYDDLSNLPVLSTVATSGSYTDLVNTPSIPASVNDLSDVDTTGITSGQVLQFDGNNFVAATISGGSASTLNDLTDVDTATSAPTSGDTLVYNGTEWVPQAPAVSGSGAKIERVRLNYTSGGLADGTIGTSDAFSDVTSGVSATLVTNTTNTQVEIEISSTTYNYPPAQILFYGYEAANARYQIRPYSFTSTDFVYNNGTKAAPDTFGSFDKIKLLVPQGRTGASSHTETAPPFTTVNGHAYIMLVFHG